MAVMRVEAKMQNKRERDKILIVDDSEMNRGILADILEDKYEILEGRMVLRHLNYYILMVRRFHLFCLIL